MGFGRELRVLGFVQAAWWYSRMRPEDRFACNPSFVEADDRRYRRRGGVGMALVQALVGTMPVVMRRVLAEDSPGVTRSCDQDPVSCTARK